MNRREQDEQAAVIVLTLVVQSGPDGFTRTEIEDELLAAGIGTPANVRLRADLAIAQVRKDFGSDVVIYSHRLKRYRSSVDRIEAMRWLIQLLRQISNRIRNCSTYLTAALDKYGHELLTDQQQADMDDVVEQLRRVGVDTDRAMRAVVGLA